MKTVHSQDARYVMFPEVIMVCSTLYDIALKSCLAGAVMFLFCLWAGWVTVSVPALVETKEVKVYVDRLAGVTALEIEKKYSDDDLFGHMEDD